METAMENVRIPAMRIRGALSDVVTKDGINDIFARLPGITVVEVSGAGQMIAEDKNDAFTHAIVTFLQERVRPAL